jgi:hypothetical protein
VQIFAFLGVATCNIVARNSLAAPGLLDAELARRRSVSELTLCNSLTLATLCGLASCCMLRSLGGAFLSGMGASAELMGPALQYLEIRCAGGSGLQYLGVRCAGAVPACSTQRVSAQVAVPCSTWGSGARAQCLPAEHVLADDGQLEGR